MSDKPKLVSNFNNSITFSVAITEEMIKELVDKFYTSVRQDALLGPIFADKIQNNWDEHLNTMYNFWSSIALTTGRYKGQPLLKHLNLPKLEEHHFIRWITLFTKNAHEICPKDAAEFFIDRAKRIADSLMRGIAFYHEKEQL